MSAVFYQSSQTNGGATASVAVNKPSSLAVGDLMVAAAAAYLGGGVGAISAPAGWTQVGQTTSGQNSFACFYKVADANDVAASTFTFTVVGTTPDLFEVAISRITSANPISPIGQSATADTNSVSGVTPTESMGLFLMILCASNNAGASGSVAGYAIANNNPTWVEAYDVAQTSTRQCGVAMAYANSTRLSATGIASATLTGYNASKIFLLNIVPTALAPLVVPVSLGIPSVPVSVGSPLRLAASIGAAAAVAMTPDWSNAAKSAASIWNNTPKS